MNSKIKKRIFIFAALITIGIILLFFVNKMNILPIQTIQQESKDEKKEAEQLWNSKRDELVKRGIKAFIYTKVLAVEKDSLRVQEVLSVKTPDGKRLPLKTFIIKPTSETVYSHRVYQKDSEGYSAGFVDEKGKHDDIKKGMYVYAMTSDNPFTTFTLTAPIITYFEQVPKRKIQDGEGFVGNPEK